MKYLLTVAMALALTGVAASAMADTPPDEHHKAEERGGHPPPAKGAPPRSEVKTKQQTLDREDARLHTEQRAVNASDARLHTEQRAVNASDARLHTEQRAVNAGDARLHTEQRSVNASDARLHGAQRAANFDFRSHAPRAADRGRAYYSAGAFQREVRPSFRFHATFNAYPGGWYERSWNYGDVLPFGWFAPAYYLSWASYQLPGPPIGCEWVREGHDAVLVNVWTGDVLSVYRGIFW
jgi:Ni/Co efflux regulator RcnB